MYHFKLWCDLFHVDSFMSIIKIFFIEEPIHSITLNHDPIFFIRLFDVDVSMMKIFFLEEPIHASFWIIMQFSSLGCFMSMMKLFICEAPIPKKFIDDFSVTPEVFHVRSSRLIISRTVQPIRIGHRDLYWQLATVLQVGTVNMYWFKGAKMMIFALYQNRLNSDLEQLFNHLRVDKLSF